MKYLDQETLDTPFNALYSVVCTKKQFGDITINYIYHVVEERDRMILIIDDTEEENFYPKDWFNKYGGNITDIFPWVG